VSNRAYDAALYHEYLMSEIACCECGYHRNGAHHPKVKCPKTGRCGDCGNNWPCPDHITPKELEMKNKTIEALTELQGVNRTLGRIEFQLRRCKPGSKRHKEIQDTRVRMKDLASELTCTIYQALIKLERLVLVHPDKEF